MDVAASQAQALLSTRDAATLLAVAEAATPAGSHVPQPDRRTVAEVCELVSAMGPNALGTYKRLLHLLDLAAVPRTGRRLSALPEAKRQVVLVKLAEAAATHWLVRGVTAPIKIVQVRREGVHEAVGALRVVLPPARDEARRSDARIVDARTLTGTEEIEVDVVIVGTGAGGPPMARALAARGHAVLMVEEGDYFRRSDFDGRLLSLQRRLFRSATLTIGNTIIPVPVGCTVGGTTTINSGTCFRPPLETMRRWRVEDGLEELTPGELEPFFERVEAMLEVTETTPAQMAGSGRIAARGAEALGWESGPLRRNAPECDGQALCCFGCPTDAKRSTNVTYVPAALEAGAMLYCNARVERVLLEGGRAVGVVAKAKCEDGEGATIRVRAASVVLACGTLHTPAMLLRQGLANSSGELGKNLTVHPASHAWARYEETIRGWDGVPQGYSVDQFTSEGLRFEGAFIPLELAAASMPQVGRAWTSMMEGFDRMACFGFMTADTSRGRVSVSRSGAPRMRYVVNAEDTRRFFRAHGLLARLFFAAGAEIVYPGIQQVEPFTNLAQVESFERWAPGKLSARHVDLSAFHPLGTCRMGVDPRTSVVGPTHETHDVPGLFICDGSVVGGPLGVNPQITIMALSERAARFVERDIERAPVRARPKPQPAIEFAETMSGEVTFLEGGREADVTFTVRATAPDAQVAGRGLTDLRGTRFELAGTLSLEGVATAVPCEGSLHMRPRRRRGTLVYELDFVGDDGEARRLYGQKHVGLSTALTGMVTLYAEVSDAAGEPVAKGVMRFAWGDVPSFLETWRVRPGVRAEAS